MNALTLKNYIQGNIFPFYYEGSIQPPFCTACGTATIILIRVVTVAPETLVTNVSVSLLLYTNV